MYQSIGKHISLLRSEITQDPRATNIQPLRGW